MRFRALAMLLAVAAVAGVAGRAEAVTHRIYTSNLRFCERTVPAGDNGAEGACLPATRSGTPLPTDENHVTEVTANTPVLLVFEYDDHLCDAIVLCPGHNVAGSGWGGGAGGTKNTITVTRTFAQGNHPYICTVHADFGMSGIIRAQ